MTAYDREQLHQTAEGEIRPLTLKTYLYQLIYRVEGDEVCIYAVAHLKKAPRLPAATAVRAAIARG